MTMRNYYYRRKGNKRAVRKSVSDYLFPIFPNRKFGKMGNK